MRAPRRLPVHPGIEVLTLANGFTCWVRPNSRPPGTVSLGLHVGAGSLNESESERGVSHMLEHLAFEGGARFPRGDLERFFDSLGTRLGRDHNAFTGREWTCYTLSLPVDAGLDRGLACLADFAYGMSLEGAAVEQERQVILEEMRQYQGTASRVRERVLSVLAPWVAERHPLGTEDVVRSMTAERLRSYYGRWYRPDNSTLLIAGEVEVSAVERLLQDHFAAWPPAPEAPWPATVRLRPPAMPRAVTLRDPDATAAQVRLVGLEPSEQDGLRRQLAGQVARWLVNQRLDAGAQLTLAPLVHDWNVVLAVADGPPERLDEMLEALVVELKRVRVHGFSAEETEEGRGHVLSAARQAQLEEDNAVSATLLQEMIAAVPRGRPPLSPAWRLAQVEGLLPDIGDGELRSALAGLDPARRLLVAVVPERAGVRAPEPEELLRLQERGEARKVDPPVVPPRPRRLLEIMPEAGTVAEQREDAELGLLSATLANGVRVHLRPMTARKNRAFVEITLAGGRIREGAGDFGITGAAALAFSQMAAENVRADKAVALKCLVEEDAVVLRLAGDPRDLEHGFELVHLLLRRPRLEAAALERWRSRMEEHREPSLEARLALEAMRLLTGGDPRFRLISPRQARSITLDRARRWLDSELCRAPIEAAVTGDLERGRALELALRYLGSLPARPLYDGGLDELRRLQPTPLYPPKGTLQMDDGPLTVALEAVTATSRAAVLTGWLATPWHEVDDRYLLQMASRIVGRRCHEELRKRRGMTYSADCTFSPSRAYPRASLFSAAFYTPPARATEAAAATRELVEELAADGPSEAEMEAVSKQLSELTARAERDPRYWSRVLADFAYRGRSLEDLRGLEARLATFTGEDLRAALARCVTESRRLEVTCLPVRRTT